MWSGVASVSEVSAETVERRTHRSPYWHAPLCAETLDEIADRMRAVLDGHHFTLVCCNSYSDETELFSSVEVYPSQWLTTPVDVRPGDWTYLGWATPRLSMGVHTKAKTRADGRNGRPHDYILFGFEGRQITIDHYAPAGYRLRWIFAVERHDPDDFEAMAERATAPGAPS